MVYALSECSVKKEEMPVACICQCPFAMVHPGWEIDREEAEPGIKGKLEVTHSGKEETVNERKAVQQRASQAEREKGSCPPECSRRS